MPYPQVLFLNAPNLSLATSVFTDSNMNYCAPDGWYTDGVVIRQQIACRLGPAESCPSCVLNCKNPGEVSSFDDQFYGSGIFKIPIYSTLNGAIVIKVNSSSSVIGIRAYNNLITANTLSTEAYTPPTNGYLAGVGVPVPNLPVYIGNETDRDNCGLPKDPGDVVQFPLTNYTYDFGSGAFLPTGSTLENIYVEQMDVGPGSSNPWTAWMVLPKPTSVSNDYYIEVYSPCSANWSISVSCPQALPAGRMSFRSATPIGLCALFPYVADIYYVDVAGSSPNIDLNDWVFLDSFGQNAIPDGYYRVSNLPGAYDVIRVINSRVVELLNC